MRFPEYKVLNGDPCHSDHRPVTVFVEKSSNAATRANNAHSFRFEAKWLQEEECEKIVNDAWTSVSLGGGRSISQLLKAVAHDLQDWDSNVLGDLPKRIKELKKDLEKVRRQEINQQSIAREHFLRDKLDRLEHQWDTFWRQRAHVKWLQSGDKNTSFSTHLHQKGKKQHAEETEGRGWPRD